MENCEALYISIYIYIYVYIDCIEKSNQNFTDCQVKLSPVLFLYVLLLSILYMFFQGDEVLNSVARSFSILVLAHI